VFFFFSSRRRHTRFSRDWSSDVCSSDLSWKKIDKCWNAESGKSMLYNSEGKITFYSMMSSGERMILSTPKIKAGTYNLTLDISRSEERRVGKECRSKLSL